MPLSSHAQRIITGLVLLALLAFAVTHGGMAIFIGILLASLAGLHEFYTMFWPGRQGRGKKLLGSALAAAALAAAWRQDPQLILFAVLAAFWAGNLFFLFAYSRMAERASYQNAAVLTGGILYLPLTLSFFFVLSPAETWLVLAAAIVSDTGAYYAGRRFGRRHVWPRISPKKTWEGSLGGLAACVAFTTVYGLWLGNAAWWAWIPVGVALNLASQFGDFFESALKRKLEVKDSGTLLPGHGGVLDRIDSLLLVTPTYAAIRALWPLFA